MWKLKEFKNHHKFNFVKLNVILVKFLLLLNKDIYKVIFCTKYTNKYIYFNLNSICGVVDRITLRILNVSRYIFADEAFIRSRVLRHVRFNVSTRSIPFILKLGTGIKFTTTKKKIEFISASNIRAGVRRILVVQRSSIAFRTNGKREIQVEKFSKWEMSR